MTIFFNFVCCICFFIGGMIMNYLIVIFRELDKIEKQQEEKKALKEEPIEIKNPGANRDLNKDSITQMQIYEN